jgi:hypothetical protein
MHIALADLELGHLVVIYPGERVYPLHERVTVVPLGALATDDESLLTTKLFFPEQHSRTTK